MLWTLCRIDKLTAAQSAFNERSMMDRTTASYTAMVLAGGAPQWLSQSRVNIDGDADNDDDNGPVAGPKVLLSVKLASKSGALVY